jgi:uncharacterized damage-inducible protein DinB
MADQKPPYLAGDERAVLCALLQYLRESVVRKIEGLDDEAATRAMVVSGTSLMWLVKHLAYAETIWFVQRFAGETVELPDPTVHDHDTVSAALDLYRATWSQVDAIIAAASLDDLCVDAPGFPPLDLRWVLAHMLEETARHAGHADIIRELIDGQTGR